MRTPSARRWKMVLRRFFTKPIDFGALRSEIDLRVQWAA
jgi:hypothetical protein